MSNAFKTLFSPLELRGLTLPNRVVMMPMGSDLASVTGEISDEHIEYYKNRALGGTGLIILENVCVKFPEGSNGTTQLRLDADSFIPRLFKLTEACHRCGSKMGVQINHAGASAMSSRIGMQPVSASTLPSKPGGEAPRPLTREELESIAKDYGAAAKRAVNAGFDLVEIHAGHSYLISQFLSPTMNDRTDEFGGSAENRSRFCRMVLDEVRRAVGPRVPISLRISTDELVDGGNGIADCLEYLKYLDSEVDVYDASCALNQTIQYQIDVNHLADGWRSYMAAAVKERFGKPTISMGNYRDPRIAEGVLNRGEADLIGIGRGLIADPDWCRKARSGAVDDIRKCISCNTGCVANRIGGNKPLRCAVNPDIIEGDRYKRLRVSRPCHVVVIGAGTAGMEAACTAAELGCSVTLFEKNAKPGGLAAEISKLPAKERLADFPNYLIRRMEKLPNLCLRLNTRASGEMVAALHPQLVINATGSTPLLPPIEGLKECLSSPDAPVYTVLDLIENMRDFPGNMPGKRIAVIGGGAVGLDVVEFFAPRGCEISIVEMLPNIGNGLDAATLSDMRECMEKHAVRQLTGTALTKVTPKAFVLSKNGEAQTLTFDYGFICLGMKANASLMEELEKQLENTDAQLINIGDSLRARRIIEGVDEGRHRVLAALEASGFLSSF